MCISVGISSCAPMPIALGGGYYRHPDGAVRFTVPGPETSTRNRQEFPRDAYLGTTSIQGLGLRATLPPSLMANAGGQALGGASPGGVPKEGGISASPEAISKE
eukprot:9478871-Pyramimonas_sp.AAC.1